MTLIIIALLAAAALALVLSCVWASREKASPEQLPLAQAIADKSIGPGHDHDPDTVDKPCPAIQEADIPQLVAVTPEIKFTPVERLMLENADRSRIARTKAANCANYLASGRKPEEALIWYDYASADSMRKALNRYGWSITGQPLERKADMHAHL